MREQADSKALTGFHDEYEDSKTKRTKGAKDMHNMDWSMHNKNWTMALHVNNSEAGRSVRGRKKVYEEQHDSEIFQRSL